MRILFATDSYLPTPGGITIVTQRLSSALAKKGHTVAVIAPSISWNNQIEEYPNLTIYRIRSFCVHKTKKLYLSPFIINHQTIASIIKNFQPDIIHLETPQDIACASLKAGRKFNIPVIATCHIMPENISGTLLFLPLKIRKILGNIYMHHIAKFYNKVDLITSPTPTGTSILHKFNINKPSIALSNGIDLQHFQKPSEEAVLKLAKEYNFPPHPIILYIGRLDKEKKVDILIKSLKYIGKQQPFHLVIEGKGQQENYLKNMAKELDLSEHISFIGFIEEKELPALYALSTVFVMPSTAELQSLVTMEAMALGLPVIGAKAGALPYLIKPDINGFLFQPDNPEDLADKLIKILRDPKLQKQMSVQSLTLIKEHDINNIIEKMETLYTKIINTHKEKFSEQTKN